MMSSSRQYRSRDDIHLLEMVYDNRGRWYEELGVKRQYLYTVILPPMGRFQ